MDEMSVSIVRQIICAPIASFTVMIARFRNQNA